MRPRIRRGVGPAVLVAVVLATGLAGCGGAPPAGGPLADLPECDPLPTPAEAAPPDVVLPAGTVVTQVDRVPPLVQVTGLVDATPVEVRGAFDDDARAVHVEDEGFEAEVLLVQPGTRTYLRITARCRTGSVVTAIRAPDDAADRLPVPGAAGG